MVLEYSYSMLAYSPLTLPYINNSHLHSHIISPGISHYTSLHLSPLFSPAPQMPDFDLKTVMNTWSNQMGYPVVNLDLSSDGILSMSQQRFLTDAEHPKTTIFTSPYGFVAGAY